MFNVKATITSAALAAVVGATLVGAPTAAAKPKGNTITAPTTVAVGEEFTIKTRFNAKDLKNKCFSPNVQWGDEVDGVGVISYGGFCNGVALVRGNGGKKFRSVKDTHKHTYDKPGTYTITVGASYVKSGFDGGLSTQSSGPATADAPKKSIKGKRLLSHTITVTSPDAFDVTEERKAQILVNGYRAETRDQMVELVNALDWDGVWITDVGVRGDSLPLAVDYFNVAGGEFLVTRSTNSSGGIFTEWLPRPGSDVRLTGMGSSIEVPLDAPLVDGGPGWTSGGTGEPVQVWLFANGTQVASRSI